MIKENGKRLPTVTDDAIRGFFGEYRFLSNYEECVVVVDGASYRSSEAAYMAQKTLDPDERKHFESVTNAAQAKRLGRLVALRENWDSYRVLAMTKVVLSKFITNPQLADKLMATGDKYLEETNDWGDTFWGVVPGKGGVNMLGHILMYVRDVVVLANSDN